MIRIRFFPVCLAAALFLLGLGAGVAELWHPGKGMTVAVDLLYGLCAAALVLWGARTTVPERERPGAGLAAAATLALAFVVPLLLADVVLQAYPVSADEYGYNFLADTLRHGRLWNASAPSGLGDVLKTMYVPDLDGKRLSQYPPGWPAVLALFASVGLRTAANPVLGVLLAAFLALGLRQLGVTRGRGGALLALSLLAPFTLFNNASFFNHTLTGTCILAVAWLGLRDERRPTVWAQLALGFAFSVLLTTRYEAFLLAFGLYVLDGLLRRRRVFVRRSLWAALGALPVVAMFAWYNWRITGSPFVTTLSWGFPDLTYGLYGYGTEGPNTPFRSLERTVWFSLWWMEFACVAVLPFVAVALWRGVRQRTLRWFDLMLPATILFFFAYPDLGGYQYGPRYWFIGWVTVPLTLGRAFRSNVPWALGRWQFDPMRLAGLQVAAYAGFVLSYSVFAHLQVSAVREPLRAAATAPAPALVLIASDEIRYVSWQSRPIHFDAVDTTRNGPDGFTGPILHGIDLGEARIALLCRQVHDRTIWRVRVQGAPPKATLEPACGTPQAAVHQHG